MPDGSAPVPSAQEFLPLETGQMYEFPKGSGPMAGSWTVQGVDPKTKAVTLWRAGAKKPTVLAPQDLLQRATPTGFRPPLTNRNQRLEVNGQSFDLGFFDAKTQKYAVSLPNGLTSTVDAQIIDRLSSLDESAQEAFSAAVGTSTSSPDQDEKKSASKKAGSKPLALAADAPSTDATPDETDPNQPEIELPEEDEDDEDEDEEEETELDTTDLEDFDDDDEDGGTVTVEAPKEKPATKKEQERAEPLKMVRMADLRVLREEAQIREETTKARLADLTDEDIELENKIRLLNEEGVEGEGAAVQKAQIEALTKRRIEVLKEIQTTEKSANTENKDIMAIDRERRRRFEEKKNTGKLTPGEEDAVAVLTRTIEARQELKKAEAEQKKLEQKKQALAAPSNEAEAQELQATRWKIQENTKRIEELNTKRESADLNAEFAIMRSGEPSGTTSEPVQQFIDAKRKEFKAKRALADVQHRITKLETERAVLTSLKNPSDYDTGRLERIEIDLRGFKKQLPQLSQQAKETKQQAKAVQEISFGSPVDPVPLALKSLGGFALTGKQAQPDDAQSTINNMLQLMRVQQQASIKQQVQSSGPKTPATQIAQSDAGLQAKIQGLQAQIQSLKLQLTQLTDKKAALDQQIQGLEQQLQTLSSDPRDATRVMTITTRIQELRALSQQAATGIGQQQTVIFEQQKQLDRLQTPSVSAARNDDEYQRALDALVSPALGAATAATGLATGLPSSRRPPPIPSAATRGGKGVASGANNAQRIQSVLKRGGNLPLANSLDLDRAQNRARAQGYSGSGADASQLSDARTNMLTTSGGLGGDASVLSLSSVNARKQAMLDGDELEGDGSANDLIQNQGGFSEDERRARANQAMLQGGAPADLGAYDAQSSGSAAQGSQGYAVSRPGRPSTQGTIGSALDAERNREQQQRDQVLAEQAEGEEAEEEQASATPKVNKNYNLDKMWNDAKSFWELVAGAAEGIDWVIFTVKQNLMFLHTHIAIPAIPLIINALNGKFSKVTMVTDQDIEDIRLSEPRQGCVVMLDLMMCVGCMIASGFVLIQLGFAFMVIYAVSNPGSAIYSMLFGG